MQSLCSAKTADGCNEKEKGYIEKFKAKTGEEVTAELARLSGMSDSKLKPDLKKWLNMRKAILKQMATSLKEEL